MDKRAKFTLIFIAGSVGIAIAACVATALSMIWVIQWTLSNCGTSGLCTAADWLISYWWMLFIAGSLLAAYLLRRLHDRRYAQIQRGSES